MKKQKTENLRHKIPSENKGITLIALVITIIVMLILVGVTISMAVNGGLFNYAQKAVGETKNAIEKEQQLAGGGLNIAGTWYNSINEYINPNKEVNFEELFKTATKHPDQTESDDIGIAEDGSAVDLDLWFYYLGNNDQYSLGAFIASNYYPGYKNENITSEGKIYGNVPMYIKEEGNSVFYPVTSMINCFAGCDLLITAPQIPSSVTNLCDTFRGCTALETPPSIPSGVTDMQATFSGCSSLKTAPAIPGNVVYADSAFWGCSSLTGTLRIDANPTSYFTFFSGAATNEGCALVLEGPNQDVLNNLLATKSANSNITIKQ